MSAIRIGEEWVYRLRDTAPIRRVQVNQQVRAGQYPRYEVTYRDGSDAGQTIEVPSRRLVALWHQRAAYEAHLERDARVTAFRLTDTEASAVSYVFDFMIPTDVADYYSLQAPGVTRICNRQALEDLVGLSFTEITDGTEWFVGEEGDFVVAADAGRRIAAGACGLNAPKVLDWVHQAESADRARCRSTTSSRDDREISSGVAWQYYRDHSRHVYELLRHWCGHRAVVAHERLQAAEAEAFRLDELLDRALEALHRTDTRMAEYFARERDEERITPENYRPVVDRLLRPDELPVRVEYRPRRWG